MNAKLEYRPTAIAGISPEVQALHERWMALAAETLNALGVVGRPQIEVNVLFDTAMMAAATLYAPYNLTQKGRRAACDKFKKAILDAPKRIDVTPTK